MEPDPEQQAFIDATMEPLRDDAASRELLVLTLARAATFPTRDGDDIATSTERMRSTAGSFKWHNRLVLGSSLLIVLGVAWSAVAGPPAWRSLKAVIQANDVMSSVGSMCCGYRPVPGLFRFGASKGIENSLLGRSLLDRSSQSEAKLLFGDLPTADPVSQWRSVWDDYPADPRHYFAYALTYQRAHSVFPPDFVATGERLDPGNGWFRLIEGAFRAKAAIGVPKPPAMTSEQRREKRAKEAAVRLPPPPAKEEKVIVDHVAYDDAMRLLEEALAMPKLDDYRQSLDRIRFEATPPATDLATHCSGVIVGWGQPEDSGSDWPLIPNYAEGLSLSAVDAAKRGDRKELERVRDRSLRLSEGLLEMSSSVSQQISAMIALMLPGKSLAQAWIDVGEPEKGKEFESVMRKLDSRLTPLPKLPPDAWGEMRGSGLMTVSYKGRRDPGTKAIQESELRGGRLAEYALYERLMLHVAATLLFATAIFLSISRFCSGSALGLLPDRLAGLLKADGYLRIFIWSVILPTALYAFATRNPWMASRGFTLSEDRFFMWLVQAIGLGSSVILLTIHAIRRAFVKRGSVLALDWRRMDPGPWLVLISAIAMVAGPGVLAVIPDNPLPLALFWISVGIMAGFPWLWILLLATGKLASEERKLHRAVFIRVMIPFVALDMLLVAISIPAVYSEEKYWVSRIDFEALRAETKVFSERTELEYAEWMRQRTLRALNEEKLIPKD